MHNDSLIGKLEALRPTAEAGGNPVILLNKAIAIVRQHQAEQSGKESMTRDSYLAALESLKQHHPSGLSYSGLVNVDDVMALFREHMPEPRVEAENNLSQALSELMECDTYLARRLARVFEALYAALSVHNTQKE